MRIARIKIGECDSHRCPCLGVSVSLSVCMTVAIGIPQHALLLRNSYN